MAEARFLASRESRQEGLQSRKNRYEDLHHFWASLKAYLHEWDQQLDALVATTRGVGGDDSSAVLVLERSEDDKRRWAVELNRLADDLRLLKRHCVSDSNVMFLESTSRSGGKDATDANDARWQSIVPALLDRELPSADLRLLHDEFSKHHDKLDRVRTKLLPKGKFVFRKYREAMKRQQEASSLRSPTGTTSTEPCPATKPDDDKGVEVERQGSVAHSSTARCSLEGLDSVRVVLDAQGRAYNKQLDNPSSTGPSRTTPEPFLQLDVVEGESALILRNIQNCTIELLGSYQSLHLVNVVQSTVQQVVVGSAVQGAIHITNCRHVTCVAQSCQQVRLHESTDLQLKIGLVKGGAILEECHRIVFVVTSVAASKTLEVRDFSFLKRGQPSPNFTVEIEPTSHPEALDQRLVATGDEARRPIETNGIEEQAKSESVDAKSEFQGLTGTSNLEDDDDDDDEEL